LAGLLSGVEAVDRHNRAGLAEPVFAALKRRPGEVAEIEIRVAFRRCVQRPDFEPGRCGEDEAEKVARFEFRLGIRHRLLRLRGVLSASKGVSVLFRSGAALVDCALAGAVTAAVRKRLNKISTILLRCIIARFPSGFLHDFQDM
jgi:hypothetical protein